MHIINFNAMKALGNVQSHGKCRNRLTIADTSNPLRLNRFFLVKTRLNALKRVFCTLSVLMQYSSEKHANALNYANLF